LIWINKSKELWVI